MASPTFVGRARELVRLAELAAAAAGGEPAFVLVGGESGVGKSRLVAEFAGRAAAGGARILSGDCVDLGGGELPYAPLVAALRGVDPHQLEQMLGRGAKELAPLLPQLEGEDTALVATSHAQGRLFELLLALLAGLGADQPLVLTVEDAHWADPSTRDFLSFLIRNRRRERLMVIVTYRTDELHRRHPLRAFLAEADRARTTRLTLERFTRDELTDQLTGILGHAPPARLIDDLYVRAEGNPFFTEELLAAGGGHGDGRLPDDVREALMLRIELLSADAQAVLRVAAAAGPSVRHGLLVAATPLEPDALLAGVREAVAHHVLVQEPGSDAYRFRHALLREAIADDLLPGERGPIHASLGRALSEDPSLSVSGRGVAAELAFHWSAAHDLPAAFAASAQAGAEAERMAAFAEANVHFERAAELWHAVPEQLREASPSRVELLRRAAEAALLSGDGGRAVALGRSALALVDADQDPALAAGLHERIGRFLVLSGLSQDALDELGQAVELMPAGAPPADRARVLSAEAHLLMLMGRGAEAQERCEVALALAREAGSRHSECAILNTLGGSLAMSGDDEGGLARLLEARTLAEEISDPEELIRVYINLPEILDRMGRLQEAVEVSREGVAMARREGIPAGLPSLISELVVRLIRVGRWSEADEILPEALAATEGWGVGVSSTLVADALLRALRGDAAGAEEALEKADRALRQAVGSMWTAPVTVARAEWALWSGQPERAREAVGTELARLEPTDELAPQYLAPVVAVGVRAEADLAARARATGDGAAEAEAVRRAETIYELGCDLLRRDAGWEAPVHVAGAEAELARARGAMTEDTWPPMIERWDELGNVFMAAYARWRHAASILERGGPRGDVPATLSRAHTDAVALGAMPLRAEVDGLARRARIALDEPPPDTALRSAGSPGSPGSAGSPGSEPTAAERIGLTARELDVLTLVAQGSTNREIAGALYISQKTVTVHVSRILAKLDARSRVEAAGLAQRLGLLDGEGNGQRPAG